MEEFLSGYCRALDKSRMVELEREADAWSVDCAYPDCPHAAVCEIGKRLTQLLRERR